MEIIPFEYSTDFPFSLSKTFTEYLNGGINGKLIIVKEGETIVPLLLKTKLRFKIGYFVHIPLKSGVRLMANEEKEFIESLSQFLKKHKLADFVIPPLHIENFSNLPKNAVGHKLGIIAVEIENKTETQIFEAFKPVYRRHIRNAEKIDVEIKFGAEYFDDFYSIYSEKLKQENAVHDSYETLKKMIESCEEGIHFQCGVAYLNGKIEAGILNVSDKFGAYYLFGGSSRNAHNGSFRLLHWELIKKYKALNLKYYKLGAHREGSMLTEKHARLASFKMGFGAEIQEGFQYTLIIRPIKFWLYNKLIHLKSKV